MSNKTLNISDEERALLTDEEIAGMMEGEDFDEDQDEDGDGQDDGGSGDDGQAGNDDGGDAGDQGGDAGSDGQGDQSGQDGNDDGAEGAGRDDGGPADTATVSFDTVLPEDFDEQVAKISTDKDALITAFDEGDITSQEYHKQLDALNKQERELERIKDRAEYDLLQRRKTWVNVHVKGFLEQHPEYKAPALNVALDMEVRKLQASGNYESDTDPKILADAHELIAAQIPGAFGQKQDKPQGKTAAAPAKKPTVPTLANVPAANIDQPGSGEFDMLDRLQSSDPLRYQDELEKLARTNPAKYDEYLAS